MSADAVGRATMADEDGGSGHWGKNSLNVGSVNEEFRFSKLSMCSSLPIITFSHLIFVYINFYRTDN